MLETLSNWDNLAFHYVNQVWTNGLLDTVFPVLRNKYTWFPFYILGALFLFWKFKHKGTLVVVFALLTTLLTDQFSAGIIKPIFERLRPCHADGFEGVRTLVHCGGGYSFISSHATNHFGIAVFLISIFRPIVSWIAIPLLLWAGLIAYGQVYVGVHYPFDILIGGLMGSLIGFGTFFLWTKAQKRIFGIAYLV